VNVHQRAPKSAATRQGLIAVWSPMRFLRCASKFAGRNIFAPVVCFVLIGCNSHGVPEKPTLEITEIPPANSGGPAQMDFIGGRVSHAAPGQQVVVYAHGGIWWVQPFAAQPFTSIQPDATWRNSTHLGTEYAAILTDAGYHPAPKMATLPPEGNGVLAVATVKGKPVAPIVSKTVHFSGYDWNVRIAGSDRGGQPNTYDPENVWIDGNGYLHLRMQQGKGAWLCAEVSLARSLGYGSYTFVVQDIGHLNPSAVFGLYTADDMRTDDVLSELDIEVSRWGKAANKNAQFVVQPFYVAENVARFMAPAGVLTYTFRWEPGRASFRTTSGPLSGPASKTVSEHVFTSGIPNPSNEAVHIELYDYRHSNSSSPQPTEVVIEKFEFLP
jgi:hypothetical protein